MNTRSVYHDVRTEAQVQTHHQFQPVTPSHAGEKTPQNPGEISTEKPLTCYHCEISTRFAPNDSDFSLKSSAKTSTQSSTKKSAKLSVERWRALGVLWKMSSLPRVRSCSHYSVLQGGQVGVRQSGNVVGYSGLATCGSVWACPRCSARIQAVRRMEIGLLVALAAAEGLTVAFGTVTLRHKKGQKLADLWRALSEGQRGVSTARRIRRLRESLNRIGYVRATEVTHGNNGWHPHLHTLQLFEGDVSQEELDELRDAEFDVWVRQCKRRKLGLPMKERYTLTKVNDFSEALGDYFAKAVYEPDVNEPNLDEPDPDLAKTIKSITFEMSGSQTKEGYLGSRTPWQILNDFIKTGDLDDWDLFKEYELASKGKRSLVWSNGLKNRFKVDEVTDEEIVDTEVGSREDTLFWITDWSPIVRNPSLGGKLLNAVRSGGSSGGIDFARSHGISVIAESELSDPEQSLS